MSESFDDWAERTPEMVEAIRKAELARMFECLVIMTLTQEEEKTPADEIDLQLQAFMKLMKEQLPGFSMEEAFDRFTHTAIQLPHFDELHLEKNQYKAACQLLRAFHAVFQRGVDEYEIMALARPEDSPLHAVFDWDLDIIKQKERARLEAGAQLVIPPDQAH